MNIFDMITKIGNNTIESKEEENSTRSIVEEIHETFYTEVDRLLEYANIKKSTDPSNKELFEKAHRLEKLGFYNTKEVSSVQEDKKKIASAEKENIEKEDLKEAIKYFSSKYPQHKFITENSVKRICEKYGLVYGIVSRYNGSVPDKNVEQIELFKISEEDKCYIEDIYDFSAFGAVRSTRFMSQEEFLRNKGYDKYLYSKKVGVCPMEIAAPISDFDMTGLEIKDFKIQKKEIPDPVVLQPVFFNNKKHYLIVTAWGDEASDELVVNQKMN